MSIETFHCPEALRIQCIGEVHARALACLEASGTNAVRIDASAVKDIDTCGVQLLQALLCAARARCDEVEFLTSARVEDACRGLGLKLQDNV